MAMALHVHSLRVQRGRLVLLVEVLDTNSGAGSSTMGSQAMPLGRVLSQHGAALGAFFAAHKPFVNSAWRALIKRHATWQQRCHLARWIEEALEEDWNERARRRAGELRAEALAAWRDERDADKCRELKRVAASMIAATTERRFHFVW